MTATILHWPWRLDGSRDWCQGLWRAQAGERVIEFFGTKPCAEWPVAEALLLEQLEKAIAAGQALVVSGPALPAPEPPRPTAPTEQLTLL